MNDPTVCRASRRSESASPPGDGRLNDTALIDYLPIATTLVAAAFTVVLWRHLRQAPQARHILWWTIGVAVFGLGTLTEALTTLLGWHEPLFRAWYISGALLGGAPLAQGTVYLLMSRRKADRLTVWLVTYVSIASVFVIATPIDMTAVDGSLTGKVMEWQWVRAFSPFVNTYALIFLVGGAAWSAWRYWRRSHRSGSRVLGNTLIAVGALLPGVGGAFTRFGFVQVLFATEFIGLLLIWAGYRVIVGDRGLPVHRNQLETTEKVKV